MSASPVAPPRTKKVHPVDQVPPVPKLLTYGFQHVAAFYAGAVIVPLIAKLVRFFPPVVTGSVLTIIGVTLLPVAANHAIGGQLGLPGFDWSYSVMGASPGGHGDPTSPMNFGFAIGTVLFILLLQRFFKGFLSTISVLLGLIAGAVVWYLVHPGADWSSVENAGWFWFATPFHFGMPRFELVPALLILLVMMITAVETVGSLYATGDIVGKRIRKDDIAAALRADGLSTVLGGSMGSFPYTCFAENIGLVRVTGVKSRWIVAVAGGFMIILGLFPKAAALVGMIPEPVLGGAALVLFAAVAVVGIQTLSSVDFNDHRNLIVAGTSIAIGVYVMAFPAVQDAVPEWLKWYFSGGIAAGAFTALLLNVLFFHVGGNRGPAITKDAAGDRVHLAEINAMTREKFEETFSSVVQGNTWALDRAFAQRPYPSSAALGEAFQDALITADPAEQATLLQSFPDLGAVDDDGQPAAREYGEGALATIDEDEQAEIAELAHTYRERFGFPLIVSAREHDRFDQLLRVGWTRMDNSPMTEKQAALIEISKIVNHRYDQLVADANPISSARFGRFAGLGTE